MSTNQLPKPPSARLTVASVTELDPRLWDAHECIKRGATAIAQARDLLTAVWGEEDADALISRLLDFQLIRARARIIERHERQAARKGGAE